MKDRVLRGTAGRVAVMGKVPLLCTVLFLFSILAAPAAERQALTGHIPEAVKRLNLQPLGRVPATNVLHLAIGLPFRNQAALGQLLQQIYDPASPQYRRYLTPAEFTARFGPTPHSGISHRTAGRHDHCAAGNAGRPEPFSGRPDDVVVRPASRQIFCAGV